MESSEVFINEEIEFSIDDEDYFWIGSYEVATESEDGDWDTPAYGDTTINILGTIQLARMDRETGVQVDIMPTRAVTDGVIEEIIKEAMSHAIAMVAIALSVVAANILFTRLIFGRHYNDAPKREKIMMDVLSFGVMVALFLIYIVLISNL